MSSSDQIPRSSTVALEPLDRVEHHGRLDLGLHKLRRAMVIPGRDLLHGEVEVDETYVGGEETRAGEGQESAGSDRRRVPWRQPVGHTYSSAGWLPAVGWVCG